MTGGAGNGASLIAQADQALARGDVRKAASLLEVAAQRGRDATVLLRLATLRRAMGDLSGALEAATAGIELSPRNFLMNLLVGSLREATGAIHGAQRAYQAACAHAPLDLSFQPAMQKQLDWAKKRVSAVERWRERLLAWNPSTAPYRLSGDERQRMLGFRDNIVEEIGGRPVLPPAFLVPGLKAERYLEPSAFAGVAELERNVDVIRGEFLALVESYGTKLTSRLSGLNGAEMDRGRPGAWSMIPLSRNGVEVEEFASKCPLTMDFVRKLDLPRLSLISPSVCFSVLEPGSRIAPHTGITNARFISHLPLIVPEDCGFRVGGETRRWETGKMLVFDDMTIHEAWNDSDRIRVVLIADLWRPELSPAEREAVTDLMNCEDVGMAV